MRATVCKSELQFEAKLQQSCQLVVIYGLVTVTTISTGDFTFTTFTTLPPHPRLTFLLLNSCGSDLKESLN